MAWSYLSLPALKTYLNDEVNRNEDAYRRALEGVSRQIDDYCNRQFQPYSAVMDYTAQDPCELMVDDLLTATSVTMDLDGNRVYETTLSTSDWELEPYNAANDERPYTAIVTRPQSRYAFTLQRRGIRIGGTWGYWSKTRTLPITLSTSAGITATSTGMTVQSPGVVEALQTVLIDSEQVYVTAVNGSVCSIDRAQNGTVAASHSTGSALAVYEYPPVVVEAARLQATRIFKRRDAPLGSFVGPTDMVENVVEVQRLDPDAEKLLESYRRKTWLAV